MNRPQASFADQKDDSPATSLVDDWVTIWQSELAALATDREGAEHLGAVLAAWFAATASVRHPAPQSDPFDAAFRDPAGPDAPSRAAAAAASPDVGDALARLEQRLSDLERRLDSGMAVPPAG